MEAALDWRTREPGHQTNIESRNYIDGMLYGGSVGSGVSVTGGMGEGMGEAPGSLSETILGEEPLRGLPVPVIWRASLDFLQTACVDDRNPRREQGLGLAGLLDWWSLENPRSIRRSRLCGDTQTHPPSSAFLTGPHGRLAVPACTRTPGSQAGRDGITQAFVAASAPWSPEEPLLDAGVGDTVK